VALVRRITLAISPHIEGDSVKSGVRDCAHGLPPTEPSAGKAVAEHDRRTTSLVNDMKADASCVDISDPLVYVQYERIIYMRNATSQYDRIKGGNLK
jgi:hypothetical protein